MSDTTRNDGPRHRYTAEMASRIEPAWQERWEREGVYRQPNPGEAGFDASKPKFYCLDMFPYPSGAGLHVGHPEGYTATDIVCRAKRMRGFNVLHPMGWDAFGLPAEQYAIQTGVHPAITTKKSIDTFRGQLRRFGFSYDWSREFGTIDPEYYKWTQWIFLRVYDAWMDGAEREKETERRRDGETRAEVGGGRARPMSELIAALEKGEIPAQVNPKAEEVEAISPAPANWAACTPAQKRTIIDSYRLAYIGETMVNWCPKLGTVLANDEVIDGRSERGGHPVLRKPLKQWMFRITAYAERLLTQLEGLEWPESTKAMQREWIGRSEGAEIEFALDRPLGSSTLRVEPASPQPHDPTRDPSSTRQQFIRGALRTWADPAVRMLRPSGFVGRDPYPPGAYGPARDLIKTQRFLPHLELPDATYFVTWHTHDGTTLSDAEKDAVLGALRHYDGQRCRVFAATVMSNHVHWIVRPYEGHSLSALVESVKHFAAVQINKSRGISGRFWEPERFDHIIRDVPYFNEFLEYIVRNPVEAGAVPDPAEYAWTFVHPDALGGGTARHAERGATQGIRVFTTRPDTLFGATYMVVAPEHPLVEEVLRNPGPRTDTAKVRAYVAAARNRGEIERMESKEKTGVDLGIDAVNPATGKPIPVWVADYVLMGYGTGAIMAVPAHDERDWEFATAFHMPSRPVVLAGDRVDGVHVDLSAYGIEPSEKFYREFSLWRDKGAGVDIGPGNRIKAMRFHSQADAQTFCREFLHVSNPSITPGYAPFAAGAFTKEGVSINSENAEVSLNGLLSEEAKKTITNWLERTGRGTRKINFRLRDWTFSRQRYWGEPFPIVFDDAGNHYPVSESDLPVTLPELADYAPIESDDPKPLLAKATNWARTTAGAAGVDRTLLDPTTPVTRECNTMPGSAGSSWYFSRYCDAKNAGRFVGREAEAYWMGESPTRSVGLPRMAGVDLYLGGSEHAVGHLLYSRFWQSVLFDLGEVSTPEPFRKLFHQGLITSFAYQRADKTLVPTDEVDEVKAGDDRVEYVERATGKGVTQIVAKMSKSLKNVVNPDEIIAQYGADTFRLYEMSMGPLEASKPWNTKDIIGPYRFLQRVWRQVVDEETGSVRIAPDGTAVPPDLDKRLHRTIAGVTADIDALSLHTAISKLIELNNEMMRAFGESAAPRRAVETLLVLLSPFAPHLCEELWSRLGHAGSITREAWPAFDPAKLVDSEVEIPVSVMGKVRGRVMAPRDADAKALEALALAEPKVAELIAGKAIKKIIVVPGKMVNIVHG